MAIGSIGRWIGNPISPPQKATSRSKGGRLLYYEAVEIGETLQHVVQVGDIVEIAQKTQRRSARVNDRIQDDQPFLAQVECMWEDNFTGMKRLRARWLLREAEVRRVLKRRSPRCSSRQRVTAPGSDSSGGVSEAKTTARSISPVLTAGDETLRVDGTEVFLTPVADEVDLRAVMGLSRVSAGAAVASALQTKLSGVACNSARRLPRENALPPSGGECHGGVEIASDDLTLRRIFDPFTCELRALEAEDVALSRLHARRVTSDEKSAARDETQGRGNERGRALRSGDGSRVRGLGVSGRSSAVSLGVRFSAERPGLSSLELDDVDAGCAASEEDSEESCSSDITEDFVLPCKRQRKSMIPSTPTRGQKRSKSLPPRRPQGDRGSASEAGATLQRPRRLAMPPESVCGRIWLAGRGVSDGRRDKSPVVHTVPAAGGTEAPVTSGKGRLMVDVGMNEEKSSGSRSKILPTHTPVGRDHQADIPEMLTPDEREAERCGDERNKSGGVLVWSSTRNRTPEEIERLERILSEAKSIQQQKQMKRGVPALLYLGVSGGKRPKRRMAWGVISSGKVDATGNVRAGCSEKEILDVPTSAIQPVQVDEETLQALFQTKGGLANLSEAPKACASCICQGSSHAAWTFAQVRALEDGINRALEDAKSRGDYELVDPEDFFDLNEVSKCVPGKSREEVTSFFMRFMAVSKPLTEVLGGAEATRMRRERIAARLRCQPAQNAAASRPPLPTLRHRPSLRQPPRLLHQMEANEPANLPLALRKTRREAAVKGCRKAASLAGRGISASESDGGTGSDAGEPPIARRRHERDPCAGGSASGKQGGKPSATAATGGSDSDEEGVDVGGGDEGGGGDERGGGGEGEGGGGGGDGGVGARGGVDVGLAARRRQETGARRPEARGEPKHGTGGRGGDAFDDCIADDDTGFDEQFRAKGMDARDSRSFQGEWEPSWERRVAGWGSSADLQSRDGYVDLRSLEHHSLESHVYGLGALGRDQHRSQQRRRPAQARGTTARKLRVAEASSGVQGRRESRVPLSDSYGYGMETVGTTRFKTGFQGENVRPRHDFESALPRERYLPEYGSRGQAPRDLRDHAYGVGSSSWSLRPYARVHRGLPNSSASCANYSAVGGGGGRIGVGYSRAARSEALGAQRGSQRSASPMSSCWLLLDEAQKYLDTARVRYLEGLLATHERQRMTYAQLVERAESCLHDKPQILESFMRIFRSMDHAGQAFRREAHSLSREVVDHSRFPDDGVTSSSSSSSRCWVDGSHQTSGVPRSELFHDGRENRRVSGNASRAEVHARTSAPVLGSGSCGRSSVALPDAPLVVEGTGVRLENGRALHSSSIEDRMVMGDIGACDTSSLRWHAVDGARAMSRGNPNAFRAEAVRSAVETEGEARGKSMGAGCLWARGIQRTSSGRVLPPSSSGGVAMVPSRGNDGEGAGSSFRLWERRREAHGDPEAVATSAPATLRDVQGDTRGRTAVDVFGKLEPPTLSTSTSPTLASDVFNGHRVSSAAANGLRGMERPRDGDCVTSVSNSAVPFAEKSMSAPASSNERSARRARLFELNGGDDSGVGSSSTLSVTSATAAMTTTMATSRSPPTAERSTAMSSASVTVSHGVAQQGTTRGEVQASLSPRGFASASTHAASSPLSSVIPRSSTTAPVAVPGAARTDAPTRASRLKPPVSPRTSTLSASIAVAIPDSAMSTSTAPSSLDANRGGAAERASVAGVVPGPASPTAEVVPVHLSAPEFTPAAIPFASNMDDEADVAANAAAEGNRRGIPGPFVSKTSPKISYAASRTSSGGLGSDEAANIAQGPAGEVSPPASTAAAKVQSLSVPADGLAVDYTASRWSCFGNTESSPPATTDMRKSFGNTHSSYVPDQVAHPRSVKGGIIREIAPIRSGGSPVSSVVSSASSDSLSGVKCTPRPSTAGFPTSPLEVFAASAPSEIASSGDYPSRCAGDGRPDLQRSQACLPVASTPSNEVAFAVEETPLAFEGRSNNTPDGSLAEAGAQDPVTVVATAGGSVASSLPLSSSYNVDEDDPPIIAKTKALAKAAFADGRFVEDIESGQSAARASLNNAERFGRCYLRGSWVKGQSGGSSAMTPPAPVPEEAVPQGSASTSGQWRTGGVWAWLGYGREVAGER